MASIASCGRPSWIEDRNVPGHTQFTRMPSRAYSTAATLASEITAALVAQYGANAVDRAEQIDAVAPLPVVGGEVVNAAVGREHACVADEHVEPTELLH